MKELLRTTVKRLVVEHESNWSETLAERYFDEPQVNFASADDPLFTDFKRIIGPWHFTPREAYEAEYGQDSWRGGTVISWVMPWGKGLRDSIRRCKDRPSVEWTLAYNLSTKVLQKQVRAALLSKLAELGHQGVAPVDSNWFTVVDAPGGRSSAWSERHVGYVAGLGSFGLNNGFISNYGMAVTLSSVVTDAVLAPDGHSVNHHKALCLFHAKGGCGVCMQRCPAGAITRNGHDKELCREYGYGSESMRIAAERGVQGPAGCALCHINVPCEFKPPV